MLFETQAYVMSGCLFSRSGVRLLQIPHLCCCVEAKPPLRLPELCGGVGVIGLSPAHAASGEVTLLSTVTWRSKADVT